VRALRRLKHKVGWRFRCRYWLYPAIIKLRPNRRTLLVKRSTSIVIEGYPRSGNTFAFEAFRAANPNAIIAHHLHAPVQMRRASRFGVPLVVLVRDPEEAVASALVQAPYKSANEALREWINFYRSVPLESPCVIAPFRGVVSDLGAVVRRVNLTYGTNFVEYENSPERDESVFRAIDSDHRARFRPKTEKEFEEFIGRPSTHRETLRRDAHARFNRASTASSLREARQLFSRFEALSDS
jgi:hypothetical protein